MSEEAEETRKDGTEMWLYRTLPTDVKEDPTLVKPTQNAKKFISSFLRKNVPKNRKEDMEKTLKHKAMIMDTVKHKTLGKRKKAGAKQGGARGGATGGGRIPQGRGKKKLSHREKKKLKLFDIPPEQHRYELYEPLHQLWLDYMREIIQMSDPMSINSQQRLLKCDLHGCVLTVTRSKCSSYVGISGILLQETRNVFKIITKENKLKTVPKSQCWFMFTVDQYAFTIYGQHFCHRSSMRASRQFKSVSTVAL